jgi:hypothetical protein
MYQKFSIQNFRGITSLNVDGLRRLNLIVGTNNAGKTSFLEGVFLLGGATNPVFPTTLGQLRGQRLGKSYPDAVWRPLFINLDPKIPIVLKGQWNSEGAERRLEIDALRVHTYGDHLEASAGGGGGIAAVTQDFLIGGLRLRYQDAGGHQFTSNAMFDPRAGNIDAPSQERQDFVRTTFLSARAYSSLIRDAQQFSFLVKIKQEQDVLEALRIVEPRIQRIEVISEQAGPAVYVDLGLPSLVPLAVCGEGFVRLFSIVVELTASRGGVLLIDEIDNGLHHSVMKPLWNLLAVLAIKHDVQIFGTTHNEDLIESALRAFEDDLSVVGLFRIDRIGLNHNAVSYNEPALHAITAEHFEVRG